MSDSESGFTEEAPAAVAPPVNGTTAAHSHPVPAESHTKDKSSAFRDAKAALQTLRASRQTLKAIRKELVGTVEQIDEELQELGEPIADQRPLLRAPTADRPKPAVHARPAAAPKPVKAAPAAAPAAKPVAKSAKGGRLARRSSEDIQAQLDDVVALLNKHSDGLRSEELQRELRIGPKEIPRLLKQGMDTKLLRKQGEKRQTTYTVR